MKNKIFQGLMLLVISIFFASCASTKGTSAGKSDTKTNDSKEAFVEFSQVNHVNLLKLSPVQISTIQMYSSKAFQLTATSYSQSVLIEEGTLILEKVNLGTIIKFKDKVKGKVVGVQGGTLLIQFHDGADGNIGPQIPFSPMGGGLYRIAARNGVITYKGVNYTPSEMDVVLMIKYKERNSSGQNSFEASGIEVTGSTSGSPQASPSTSSPGYSEPQQQQFAPPVQNSQPDPNPLMQNQNPSQGTKKPSSSDTLDPNLPN